MERKVSIKISVMQYLLCILLVFGHAIDSEVFGNLKAAGYLGFILFYLVYILNVMCGMAVPTFFVISGFLFFYNFPKSDAPTNSNVASSKRLICGYKDFFAKKFQTRVKTLLIPYLLWSVFGFLLSRITHQGPITLYGILMSNGALWYIRNLMVYVLFTPILAIICSKRKLRYLWIIALMIINIIWSDVLSYNSLVYCIIYFSIGASLALGSNKLMDKEFGRRDTLFALLAAAIAFVIAVKTPILSVNIGRFIINFTFSCALYIVLDKAYYYNLIQKRFPSLFFIYCGHMPVLVLFDSLIKKYIHIDSIYFQYLIMFILVPIITIVLLYGIQMLVKKRNQKIYHFLGGR